jgi:anti-anti-sigma factor
MDDGVRITSGISGVASIAGELDVAAAAAASASLASLTSTGPLAIDASDLRFIDLAGLRVLVSAARARGGLELHGCSDVVRRMIETARGLGIEGVDLLRMDPEPPRAATADREALSERFLRVGGSCRIAQARAARLCSRSAALRRDAVRSVTASRERRAA